jgi:hypothetical protein
MNMLITTLARLDSERAATFDEMDGVSPMTRLPREIAAGSLLEGTARLRTR